MTTASVIRYIVTVETDGGTTPEGVRLDAGYYRDAIWKAVEPHSVTCTIGYTPVQDHAEDLADACSGLDPERSVAERLATIEGTLYDHTLSHRKLVGEAVDDRDTLHRALIEELDARVDVCETALNDHLVEHTTGGDA